MQLWNKHIVVIDDTHSILTFLRISLEALGATFKGALTASGGMALCETANPDLVILDLSLPDKEGFSILPKIKSLRKKKPLPVIVLTAHKEDEAMKTAMELGADAFIRKPFDINELIETIGHQLGAKKEETLAAPPPPETAGRLINKTAAG